MSKKQEAKAKKLSGGDEKTRKKRESIVVPAGTTETEAPDIIEEEENALTLDVNVSRETLEGTPVRALTFLKAIGTSAAIHGAMVARGYSREHHLQGWALLHSVSGYQDSALPVEDRSVSDAIKQLDDWDEDGFQVIAASLRYRYPEQAAFLLTGLAPSTGAAAVLGVKQLLDRLDALESSPDRASSKQKDQAALAVLSQRGIGKADRERLRQWIDLAEGAPDVSLPDAEAIARSEAKYLKGLLALRAWFEEWAGIARVAIKRRDHLIRLGLAKRRVQTSEPASDKNAELSVAK